MIASAYQHEICDKATEWREFDSRRLHYLFIFAQSFWARAGRNAYELASRLFLILVSHLQLILTGVQSVAATQRWQFQSANGEIEVIMETKSVQNQKWRFIFVAFVGALVGAGMMMLHAKAIPLKLDEEVNHSSEIIFRRAEYVRNTLALTALTLQSDPNNDESPGYIVLIGNIDAEAVAPGDSEARKARVMGYMYLTKEDLKEFPHALTLARRSKIEAHLIDTHNVARGLAQLRKLFQTTQKGSVNKEKD